jgi:hypothetical protein
MKNAVSGKILYRTDRKSFSATLPVALIDAMGRRDSSISEACENAGRYVFMRLFSFSAGHTPVFRHVSCGPRGGKSGPDASFDTFYLPPQGLRDMSHDLRNMSQGLCDMSHDLRDMSQGLRNMSHDSRNMSQGLCDMLHDLRDMLQGLRDMLQNLYDVSPRITYCSILNK